jgi:hypothetical protein
VLDLPAGLYVIDTDAEQAETLLDNLARSNSDPLQLGVELGIVVMRFEDYIKKL